jgi:ABC-type phosphate transport system substrate-binding protein
MKRIAALMLLALTPLMTMASPVSVANIAPDQLTVSRSTVVLMYTMRVRYWSDGTRVSVFNLPASNYAHKTFIRSVLGLSPITYQQHVDRQINAGVGGNFHVVNSMDDMLNKVSTTHGAVGYVSNDYLLINQGGLRALKIVD